LNVTAGFDSAADWIFIHTELLRRGAAWVGVSAQQVGVHGGPGPEALGLTGRGLVGTDPERYGGLQHPGDRFSYDIYAQASAAVRSTGTILDGLAVDRVLAIGESQSAFRLTTYVNDLDPLIKAHEGFLIHARGGSKAPLDDTPDTPSPLTGPPAPFSERLRVPVMCVEAETDLLVLGYLSARQDDHESFALWEIAGAAHADMYTFAAGRIDTGHLPISELAAAWRPRDEVFGMAFDHPVNSGPQHYVMNAAVHHLERWTRDGTRPPAAPRLEIDRGQLVPDGVGNACGGVRTPQLDAPAAILSGLGNSGHPLSIVCGRTEPIGRQTLLSLYGSRTGYLERFAEATAAAVVKGFVLEEDAGEIVALAAELAPL
jgi:Alpha/beta hydrolase domain